MVFIIWYIKDVFDKYKKTKSMLHNKATELSFFLVLYQHSSRALQQRGTLRVMCWNVLVIVLLEDAQGEKNHGPSGERFIRFFPEPSRVKVLWLLFGFQMLFSLTPSQPRYSVQTCLHLLLVFLCMVDVLLKRPISNKSLFLFCWLIFCVFMNSGPSHGNS